MEGETLCAKQNKLAAPRAKAMAGPVFRAAPPQYAAVYFLLSLENCQRGWGLYALTLSLTSFPLALSLTVWVGSAFHAFPVLPDMFCVLLA